MVENTSWWPENLSYGKTLLRIVKRQEEISFHEYGTDLELKHLRSLLETFPEHVKVQQEGEKYRKKIVAEMKRFGDIMDEIIEIEQYSQSIEDGLKWSRSMKNYLYSSVSFPEEIKEWYIPFMTLSHDIQTYILSLIGEKNEEH